MEIKWNDSYSVNDEIIDIQHKMLFSIINDLEEQILRDEAMETLGETLEKMAVYATVHFRTEEDLLLKSNYSEYKKHKALHDQFKQHILSATDQMLKEKTMATVITLHRFLHEWITEHILKEDVKYIACIG